MRYSFKPDDGTNKCNDKEYTPETGRLFKEQDTHQHGANSTNAGPYGVGRAYGQCLCCFYQQVHTDHQADEKTGIPPRSGSPGTFFRFAKAGSKARLK